MLYFIRFSVSILSAYFWGRIIFSYFCNQKEKNNIISIFHSFLLGLGFTSISFWYYTIATNGYNSNYHIIETVLLTVTYLYLRIKKREKLFSLPKNSCSENKVITDKKRSVFNYVTIILFSLISILCLYKCTQFPDGRWDAIAMWNFRAKFLAIGNESWNRMYLDTCDYSHRDYPLFLSCIIARGFNYVGEIDTIIPMFYSWFFTILSFILPFLYLKSLKNKYYAILAVCILIYSPKLISYGCVQYADIPIGIFMLVSLYEFIMWNEENKNLPWLGMLFAGLSFWIKNEGIPWFISYSLLIIFCLYKKENNFKSLIKKFFKVIVALLPIFVSVLFVRYFAKSENDIVFGILDRLKQIFDFERYKMILPYYWIFLKQHFWILFIPIYLFAGLIDEKYNKYKYLFCIVLLMFLIYLFVYLVSPHDLFWHVDSSFDRISASYLPILVFLGCLLFYFKSNKTAILFLYLFIFITIGNLIFFIKFELNHYSMHSFQFHLLFVEKPGENKHVNYNLTKDQNESILDLKNCSDMGWYNLNDCSPDYKYGLDLVFLCFQYMVVPTILENNGYNKKIICYYTSPEQLEKFCNKKKKYKLIKKDLFTHFALLERKD